MFIREYGIEHRFTPGENVIEFTPSRTGRFSYSCWMGMIRSSITVVAAGESAASVVEEGPRPAGVTIPTHSVARAEMKDGGFQEVRTRLTDSGFEPAVLVVAQGVPAVWIIENDSRDEGNFGLRVPAYRSALPLENGENALRFMPDEDFEFSTLDSIFYGYVKVARGGLSGVDIEAVKKEAASFETLIYPEDYFAEKSGGGCCR
jgi:hypothetical protein